MDNFRWDFLEDDRPFEPLPPSGAPRRRSLVALFVGLAALAGLLIWHTAQADQREIRREILRTIQADSVTVGAFRGEAPAAMQLQALELWGNIAVVEIDLLPATSESFPLRASQVLVLGARGWTVVDPLDVSWGPRRELRTTYFRFLYFDLDADAVEQLAARIDSLYVDLAGEFGSDSQAVQGYVIEVVPDVEASLHPDDPQWLRVASPRLRPRPVDLSLQDVLTRRVGDLLSSRLLARQGARAFIATPHQRFLLECLRRSATDRWAPPDSGWLAARDRYVGLALQEGRWHDLSRFDYFLFDARSFQERQFQCSTISEFVADGYGGESVTRLAQALLDRYDWQSALETVVGRPYEEFQQQWLAWVQDRYGSQPRAA